jgi:uridine phosphorylase
VAGTFGIGLDNLLHFYHLENNTEEAYVLTEFLKHTGLSGTAIQPYIAQASMRLLNHFIEGFHHGITVTCPGFYAPQGRVLRQPLALPNLVNALATFKQGAHFVSNFEMETSAIYGLGRIMGHHCLSINTIIANRQSKTFSKNAAQSIENMITKSLAIIENL